MISTNNFHTGLTIEVNGEIYSVMEFQHVKPGKGQAFVRTKLRNLRNGSVIEKTFRAGEKVARAHINTRKVQYLYNDGENYYFMDNETFDQFSLPREQLESSLPYLKDNMVIEVTFCKNEIIGIELPNFVELEVIETEPGVKGDTASGATKNATLETGIVVQVPLFINKGDVLKINARTGEYMERV